MQNSDVKHVLVSYPSLSFFATADGYREASDVIHLLDILSILQYLFIPKHESFF